jgi:putative toxin-antitoxin system antitoxin component (TIGR02293 family)
MISLTQTTTTHYQKLTEILGKRYIQFEVQNPFDVIRLANKGVSSKVIANFRKYFNLPRESTAMILNVSEPTIYRWVKENKNLDKISTIKLFEVADMFLYGAEVFEDQTIFMQWLKMPNKALGGMQPIELIELPEGISKIRDELGKIEHGIFG